MPTPTTNEIRKRAIEIYFKDNPYFTEGSHTPEDNELKEEGQWQAAAAELMQRQPMFKIDNTEAVRYIQKLANDLGMRLIDADRDVEKANNKQELAAANAKIKNLQEVVDTLENQRQQLLKEINVKTHIPSVPVSMVAPQQTQEINIAWNNIKNAWLTGDDDLLDQNLKQLRARNVQPL
jgi:hypothetical protein